MSGREKVELDGVSLLGNKKVSYPTDYAPQMLETFPNKHPENDYFVKFNCPEFTSLCPMTGQPDFATIYISYVPGERMVESKSLKLYLFSFRNHGDFHEDCVNIIMKDLIKLMDPKYIEVTGIFTPRGGISIYPKNFESKQKVIDVLDGYNAKMEKVDEDKVISYTDYVGTLMSSVTDIINVISYVLIAFVAISLVVSSIMIGVITYISVLERKKEIGILRAIGASKKNISQVFNAETFIIGLLAGLLGIIITLLLLIPGNMLIHHLAGNVEVSAALPLAGGIILIVLSVILTLIGGLIPSKKAAQEDPVTALRTE